MAKYHIDSSKTYNFPQELSEVNYENRILIIAPEEANWIVLDSIQQLDIFNLIKSGLSIEEVLNNSSIDIEDVKNVIIQIEARKFYRSNSKVTPIDRTMHVSKS